MSKSRRSKRNPAKAARTAEQHRQNRLRKLTGMLPAVRKSNRDAAVLGKNRELHADDEALQRKWNEGS